MDQEPSAHPAQSSQSGGGAGIRTPGRLAPTAVFKTPVGQRVTTVHNSGQRDDGASRVGAIVVDTAENGGSLPLNGPGVDHERKTGSTPLTQFDLRLPQLADDLLDGMALPCRLPPLSTARLEIQILTLRLD